MLTTCEKILQKCVQRQLMQYVEKQGILVKKQSGFRKQHSCESVLNYVIMKWREERYNRKCIIAVFLDFKKAFETIDQEILINKLTKYGIQGSELEWFKSYVRGRTQRTSVGEALSSTQKVEIGVPQGSELGHCFS